MKVQDMVPPHSVSWSDYFQATDPASNPDNEVGPGMSWDEADDDDAPAVILNSWRRNLDNSAWILRVSGPGSAGGNAATLEGHPASDFAEMGSSGSTIYIATTGDDSTGDGTVGDPYETLAKALSVLPDVWDAEFVIDVADGTYAEAIDIRRYVSTGRGSLRITGNTGTPANVTFTSTVTVDGETHGAFIKGPVTVELEGLRVNVTADVGIMAWGATVTLDRVTSNGASLPVRGRFGATVLFSGNVSVTGFDDTGIWLTEASVAGYLADGTLTVTGNGGNVWAIALSGNSQFRITAGTISITITEVTRGFVVGLCSVFQHIGAGGTITIDNVSTPGTSSAVVATDGSSWSTNRPVVIDHFSKDFEESSNAYIEAAGSRTITNVGAVTTDGTAVQGGWVYLP